MDATGSSLGAWLRLNQARIEFSEIPDRRHDLRLSSPASDTMERRGVGWNRVLIVLLVLAVLLHIFALHRATEELPQGSGRFLFKTRNHTKVIRVWYFLPSTFRSTSPIVFVMHGVKRNADKYRDTWIPYAKQGQFLLLAPEFSKKEYDGRAGYNLGNMFSQAGTQNDVRLWGFTVIEDLFDFVQVVTGSKASTYNIYGHSAGGQFVHRFVMFVPSVRVRTAIAANAGWYTMPTDEVAFPYGLKYSGTEVRNLAPSFRKRLIVLLGEEDIDEKHKYLLRTPEAMVQGRHRLERGRRFYETAQRAASERNVEFQWELHSVPGVGHSNSRMAVRAAELLK